MYMYNNNNNYYYYIYFSGLLYLSVCKILNNTLFKHIKCSLLFFISIAITIIKSIITIIIIIIISNIVPPITPNTIGIVSETVETVPDTVGTVPELVALILVVGDCVVDIVDESSDECNEVVYDDPLVLDTAIV